MQCTKCGYPQTDVVYTRQHETRGHTERRRECLKCGIRFTTHEKLREPKESQLVRQVGIERK